MLTRVITVAVLLLFLVHFCRPTPVKVNSKAWPVMKNFDIWNDRLQPAQEVNKVDSSLENLMNFRNASRKNKGKRVVPFVIKKTVQ